ncbi:MAG: gfo/Idh/MocA family oxidoreductase, partial [Mesorhizobium sp.]
NGTEPATSGADNLRTLALVEAAYAGAASGEPVQLDALLR